jgi:hypothetical protein
VKINAAVMFSTRRESKVGPQECCLKSQGKAIPSLEAAEVIVGLTSTGEAEASEAAAEAVVVFSDIETLVCQTQCVILFEFFSILFESFLVFYYIIFKFFS